MCHYDEGIPSPVTSYDFNMTMFSISREWKDDCIDDEEWLGDDELGLYASSDDKSKVHRSLALSMSYHTCILCVF